MQTQYARRSAGRGPGAHCRSTHRRALMLAPPSSTAHAKVASTRCRRTSPFHRRPSTHAHVCSFLFALGSWLNTEYSCCRGRGIDEHADQQQQRSCAGWCACWRRVRCRTALVVRCIFVESETWPGCSGVVIDVVAAVDALGANCEFRRNPFPAVNFRQKLAEYPVATFPTHAR